MRTIKFRGKSKLDGRWIFGDLFRTDLDGDMAIQYYDEEDGWMNEDVYENTIGQFIGLFDCNGQEIYEGDIVRIICDGKDIGGIYKMMSYTKGHVSSILPMDNDEDLSIIIPGFEDYLVIGNIHNNPELLKGGAQ